MGCFSGCLMSSASDQKLFCGVCSAFKCSFNEFVGEKVVSLSYSSAILAPSPSFFYIIFYSVSLCNSLVKSMGFYCCCCWHFKEFLCTISCHLQIDSFISSLPNWSPFISFPSLVAMARTFPIPCWIKVVGVSIVFLLLIWEEIPLAFHSWVWC